MSIQDRAEATGKNIQGKAQEAAGKVTGNTSDEMEGKAKQGEAKAGHAKEDIKDQVKKVID
ncbi:MULTISPECIES: CsbD family protein [Cyanophyceae]|uniref:CsbD family protein n=1 Tax=Cyanophyceae TaxID=3028117 RepID=UPI0016865567|nr:MULTISPECIES: CsbD family protein [Cyanophyceae]MBD1916984.1 CsbD family protein [Phormidium sp. FACHB-77]MBD2029835.1 CsbD family protein [Phormidium sp. FACHB-322]MBD2050377.1 CsbD family protein [Leptolyngbya sp. FACHB-60]